MTLREYIEEETLEEGIKEKALGAIGGAAFALCLATAAGVPQKAIMHYDINKIVKTMEPQGQEKFKRLYKLDEQNGTNRAGDYLLSYVDNEVEEGYGDANMKKIYKAIHGKLPEVSGPDKREEEMWKSAKINKYGNPEVSISDFNKAKSKKNFNY